MFTQSIFARKQLHYDYRCSHGNVQDAVYVTHWTKVCFYAHYSQLLLILEPRSGKSGSHAKACKIFACMFTASYVFIVQSQLEDGARKQNGLAKYNSVRETSTGKKKQSTCSKSLHANSCGLIVTKKKIKNSNSLSLILESSS